MLPVGLEELKRKARAEGEAFVPVLERDGLRLGLIAAHRQGRVMLCIEALLILLPTGSPVDRLELEAKVGWLCRWVEMGYTLQHFDGEWVVAIKRSNDDDVQAELDRLLGTLGEGI